MSVPPSYTVSDKTQRPPAEEVASRVVVYLVDTSPPCSSDRIRPNPFVRAPRPAPSPREVRAAALPGVPLACLAAPWAGRLESNKEDSGNFVERR